MIKKFFALLLIFFTYTNCFASNKDLQQQTIFKAMQDEITRNHKNLKLEASEKPFYIRYLLSDAHSLAIKASNGGLISSFSFPRKSMSVKLICGNEKMSNQNYFSDHHLSAYLDSFGLSRYFGDEFDYQSIRRGFWQLSDEKFKGAVEDLAGKTTALNRQVLPSSLEKLLDIDLSSPKTLILPQKRLSLPQKEKYEAIARQLSAIFNDYPQILQSRVDIDSFDSNIYSVDTKGGRYLRPLSLAAIRIQAYTQADDGEPLYDMVNLYATSLEQILESENLEAKTKNMIARLIEKQKAPKFDEAYIGPVLFEGQAVSELFIQTLFAENDGLLAYRRPIFSDSDLHSMYKIPLENPFYLRLGKRVAGHDISVTALPRLKTYEGQALVGHLPIDSEFVIPPEKITLIKNGILIDFLNGRTPTPYSQVSNGHMNHSIISYRFIQHVGPSVIKIESSKNHSFNDIKAKFIETIKKENLDYGIIIDSMEPIASSFLNNAINYLPSSSSLIGVYRYYPDTDSKELIRTAEIANLSVRQLRNIVMMSENMTLCNTAISYKVMRSTGFGGMPSSFIHPSMLLFDELDIQQKKATVYPQRPYTPSPLTQN